MNFNPAKVSLMVSAISLEILSVYCAQGLVEGLVNFRINLKISSEYCNLVFVSAEIPPIFAIKIWNIVLWKNLSNRSVLLKWKFTKTSTSTWLCVPLSLLLLVLLPFLWLGWRTFASFLLLFAVERTNGAPVGNCTVQQSFQACPRCHWIPSRMSIGNTEWSKKEWRLNKTI